MDNNYLYHCAGCKKDDTEYPDTPSKCDWCDGSGKDDNGAWCPNCDGRCEHTPRTQVQYHRWARNDAYGIYTGLYCDKCYKSNYPYKKGRYFDPAYCGERMEAE